MTAPAQARGIGRAALFRAGGVVLFWLVMTGWLVRFEACPEYFTGRFDGYRDLFKSGVLMRSSWMRIVANGAPVGYSHTEIDIDEKNPSERYRIDSEMQLELNILNQLRKVYTRLRVSLDILSRLQHFAFTLSSDAYETRITGARAHNDRFRVTFQTGGQTYTQTLTIPDDVILYSPMLEQTLGALKPGQTRIFKTLDPVSMAVSDVRVRADRHETLSLRGREEEVTVLSADYHGMTIWSWINAEGELLRQETPLGWKMEACLPEEALSYRKPSRSGGGPELLASVAAPSDRALPEAREIRKLEIRMKGVDIPPSELATARQTVLAVETNGLRLLIRATGWPAAGDTHDPAAFSNELAATAFIQSDDPGIVQKAAEITRGSSNSVASAQAINAWVFEQVRKNPAASLPSAAAVLKTMEGDCNEHTYLTVALARAAGIPAKVVTGVVYMNDGFYYHAWARVFAGGQWVEMDPTFGQPVADATHIALAEGELAGQARLLRYIGRLSIAILAAEKELSP